MRFLIEEISREWTYCGNPACLREVRVADTQSVSLPTGGCYVTCPDCPPVPKGMVTCDGCKTLACFDECVVDNADCVLCPACAALGQEYDWLEEAFWHGLPPEQVEAGNRQLARVLVEGRSDA